jgi:hypothetical protein
MLVLAAPYHKVTARLVDAQPRPRRFRPVPSSWDGRRWSGFTSRSTKFQNEMSLHLLTPMRCLPIFSSAVQVGREVS